MADIGITFSANSITHMYPHGPGGRTRRVLQQNTNVNSSDDSNTGKITLPILTKPFVIIRFAIRAENIATLPTIADRGMSCMIEDSGGIVMSAVLARKWINTQADRLAIDFGYYPFGRNVIFPLTHGIRIDCTEIDASGTPTADIRAYLEIEEFDPR